MHPKTIGLLHSCPLVYPEIAPLLEVYQKYAGESLICHQVSNTLSEYDAISLVDILYDSKPDYIVFITPGHHPQEIVYLLQKKSSHPRYCFHIFEDFTLNATKWWHLGVILKNRPVQFICHSQAQHDLMTNFITQGAVHYCPLPTSEEVSCSLEKRQDIRQQLQIKDSEFLFLYSGDLNLQRNIIFMADQFVKWVTKHPNAKLLIQGQFSDTAPYYSKIVPPLGHYHQSWLQFLSTIPNEFKNQIIYLRPNLFEQQEDGLYCAADCLLDLSLYHDQDWASSALQALTQGTPAILSRWGGFRDLAADNDCFLVDVSIEENGLNINTHQLHELLSHVMSVPLTERKARSSRYLQRFSKNAVLTTINSIYRDASLNFRGFNWKLRELGQHLTNPDSQLFQLPGKYEFYEEIYAPYVEKRKI